MYMITYLYTLEKIKGYEIYVEPAEEMKEFFRRSN